MPGEIWATPPSDLGPGCPTPPNRPSPELAPPKCIEAVPLHRPPDLAPPELLPADAPNANPCKRHSAFVALAKSGRSPAKAAPPLAATTRWWCRPQCPPNLRRTGRSPRSPPAWLATGPNPSVCLRVWAPDELGWPTDLLISTMAATCAVMEWHIGNTVHSKIRRTHQPSRLQVSEKLSTFANTVEPYANTQCKPSRAVPLKFHTKPSPASPNALSFATLIVLRQVRHKPQKKWQVAQDSETLSIIRVKGAVQKWQRRPTVWRRGRPEFRP